MIKKDLKGYPHIQYLHKSIPQNETIHQSKNFLDSLKSRRSIRDFSDREVSKEVIENLIMAAASAPSGANKQPWTFCAISDKTIKKQIREAAEKEEFESYNGRMPEQWLKDLAPFGTDWQKPFLEIAPWLIVVFAQTTGRQKEKHYYVQESVGIACGFLITAIHQAGLATLTHTPSPMNFLKNILKRPDNERPFLLLPVGYPADEVFVPEITKKCLEEVSVFI
jgi:iodotyrosine deiodinase